MSGEKPEFGDLDNWQYRERCLSAKGDSCTVCDADGDVVVHHIDGNRENNSLDNLIPVCNQCHRDIHDHKPRVEKWVRELGYAPREDAATTVEITHETWRRLNRLKSPGQSFDEVVSELLNSSDERHERHEMENDD